MVSKKRFLLFLCLLPFCVFAQSDQHYTMFMYNKLLYNPGYTGSREDLAINAQYRMQWPGLTNSIRTENISADAPVGTYMKPFRKIAVGLSLSSERQSYTNSTDIKTYYANRIKLKSSVLSLGLSAGVNMFNASTGSIRVFQPNDPSFKNDINQVILPNVGTGAYWSGEKFFCGLSVPNLIQNRYDATEPNAAQAARQVRAYYLSGGYMLPINDIITLKPQVLVRYAKNGRYALPPSVDLNISATAYSRIMVGISYRTDGSLEFMVHMQASLRFNIGYAYDYLTSDIGPYVKGAHELVLGYEFNHERLKFTAPRFTKEF